MKNICIRLDEKTLKKTAELAAAENLERSATIRQAVAAGLDILSKKKAAENYAEGKYSLSQAAAFAGISTGEMMEFLAAKGIRANYALKEAEESYSNIGKLGKKKK
jgi:predicted HTH domain antitoxin